MAGGFRETRSIPAPDAFTAVYVKNQGQFSTDDFRIFSAHRKTTRCTTPSGCRHPLDVQGIRCTSNLRKACRGNYEWILTKAVATSPLRPRRAPPAKQSAHALAGSFSVTQPRRLTRCNPWVLLAICSDWPIYGKFAERCGK